MKENKYDNPVFFEQYSKMNRSVNGLQGAGEWYMLRKLLPDFSGKRVLDLGCGFGWHCRYAAEHGAISVVGIDISRKMLEEARRINNLPQIEYIQLPIEDIDFPDNSFDIVLSSLAFHYVRSFEDVVSKISRILTPRGNFVFSVEHPVFTAHGKQDWVYDTDGKRLHWPVDNYFIEGKRSAIFLGERVEKYHKTLTTYINTVLDQEFEIEQILEARPDTTALEIIPEMKDELRRPMILLISVKKRA